MENENPAVSVIIPLYNAEKYIGECLTSIVNQTFQDFEIVIADDCSTDNSRAVVENFFANFGDRLKLLRLPTNSGCPGFPRNFALKEACGKYVFFVDSDDLLNDTALEDFYKVAEDFNADVVYSEKCLSFDDEHGAVSAEITRFQSGKYVTEPTLETFDINERMGRALFDSVFRGDRGINFSAVNFSSTTTSRSPRSEGSRILSSR